MSTLQSQGSMDAPGLDGGVEEARKTGSAIQLLRYDKVIFETPLPGVHVAKQRISNCGWVETDDGVVVVDTLLTVEAGKKLVEEIKKTSGGPVKYIVVTHGHGDHVGGLRAFLEDAPEILGHRYLPERLEKYIILSEYRRHATSVQFNIAMRKEQREYLYPTKTYVDGMTFALGGKTFELRHARAETDDATWVWIPEIETAFVGDLIIGAFPNIGNPFKPTRFSLPWARALEEVRAKDPRLLIAGGGRAVYQGAEIKTVLDDTIEAIHSIHDQVVDLINHLVPVDEAIHRVQLPEHLREKPHLANTYSRPELAVYNIYRQYHGYFDFNPAHLLPRPEKEVMKEIAGLIGGFDPVLKRSRALLEDNQPQLALQVLDIVLQNDTDHKEARALRLKILEKIIEDDFCTMTRNTYIHYRDKDKEFLGVD